MKINKISGGPLPTNCYIITDEETGESAVIDPGFESDTLDKAVKETGNIKYILLTHGHFDHIGGVAHLYRETGAKVAMMGEETPFVTDSSRNLGVLFSGTGVEPFPVALPLNDGDVVTLGGTELKVLFTPGHTSGGCCYISGDTIFSGDTLMRLSCGRTDFSTGSYSQILESLHKLASLPGDYHVYPGHGPMTTMDCEREYNTYLEAAK